jgi:hypothetical protein
MTLINTDLITDLGVQVDSDLSYHAQIVSLVGKATQCVGILFRGSVNTRPKIHAQCFYTYIRPLLEYNSVVWNPYKKRVHLTHRKDAKALY